MCCCCWKKQTTLVPLYLCVLFLKAAFRCCIYQYDRQKKSWVQTRCCYTWLWFIGFGYLFSRSNLYLVLIGGLEVSYRRLNQWLHFAASQMLRFVFFGIQTKLRTNIKTKFFLFFAQNQFFFKWMRQDVIYFKFT